MSKRGYWHPTITRVDRLIELIETANQVRVYPSRKHAGVTMLKIWVGGAELTGQISEQEFSQLSEALALFDPVHDKKATIYTRRVQRFAVPRYLEYVVTSIALYGWHPAGRRGSAKRTWEMAQELYCDHQPFLPEAIDRVAEILTVMSTPDGSEYGQRLAGILRKPEIGVDLLPMLASAPVALDRRRAREAAAQISRHVGNRKEWIQLDYLEWTYSKQVQTKDGDLVTLYRLRDERGNQFVCWMDPHAEELPKRFSGQVQVLRHGDYLGLKETTIQVVPAGIVPVYVCPACGGGVGSCACIAEPVDFHSTFDEFDIEIE